MLAPASPSTLATLPKRAGPIDQIDRQLREAAFARKLAGEHAGKQPRVDVAAAQHEADGATREAVRHSGTRPPAGGTRALDHRLLDGDEVAHGVLDLGLGDEQDVVDQASARSAR